ncbi:peptidylprolyl isomerase [Alkalicoccus urumqiensis]|uniref:Peptidyl-prolyl cis-trans isomerase n=2 Tax=Alkalicoccus urumqiensis TaxID=1548213 RepID=A0A2P6MDV9_ALKUR|nr:peptidylprolyl isomerase [Alkalicoccus urumqiensis]
MTAGAALLLFTAACSSTEDSTNDNAQNSEAEEESAEAEENTGSEENNSGEEENAGSEEANDEENSSEEEQPEEISVDFYPQMEGDPEDYPRAAMETSEGTMEMMFFPEQAPLAVENFFTLAEEGYYDGVPFHRIIDNFMIQGGDPTATGTGGESAFGEPFEDEFDPSLAHFRGALAMANSGPATNGSQFFIVDADASQLSEEMFEGSGFPESTVSYYLEEGGTPHLDFRHTVFGYVYEGMDVVDSLSSVETNGADKPIEDVVIESIEIIEAPES